MKCEICHEADAATVLHLNKDGEDKELYVCKACAKKAKQSGKPKLGELKVIKNGPVTMTVQEISHDGELGDIPPPFIQNIIKATIGAVKNLEENISKQKEKSSSSKCPNCGMTQKEVIIEGRFGCPKCWETFERYIKDECLVFQFGQKHIGAMPAYITGEDSREHLERELKKAIETQDFEKASKLRKKLDNLDDKGKDGSE